MENSEDNEEKCEPLISGLPDEIVENCLLRLPYPYNSLVRSVSSSWNKAITDPSFSLSRKNLFLSLPYIFILSFKKSTSQMEWKSFDPRSNRWFVLPPMPCPKSVCPQAFACASIQKSGELYVLGGLRSDTESPLKTLIKYCTSTNQWSLLSPMLTARSFFAAGSIGGKIYAAGGSGVGLEDTLSTVECYDSENDTWSSVAKMRSGLARYDAAVVGKSMYVTEGWTWPFSFSPRGGSYDSESDTWSEMGIGMREGWTGVSVVLDEKLFVISEHGDCRMKVYDQDYDTWLFVGGGRFPCEALQRPFVVSGVEGRIYVVSCGLDIAIGSVFEENEKSLRVEWEVVKAPKVFEGFAPCNSQVVYG